MLLLLLLPSSVAVRRRASAAATSRRHSRRRPRHLNVQLDIARSLLLILERCRYIRGTAAEAIVLNSSPSSREAIARAPSSREAIARASSSSLRAAVRASSSRRAVALASSSSQPHARRPHRVAALRRGPTLAASVASLPSVVASAMSHHKEAGFQLLLPRVHVTAPRSPLTSRRRPASQLHSRGQHRVAALDAGRATTRRNKRNVDQN
jgi:hypothetical protein